MQAIDYVKCTVCDSEAIVIEELRYNGLRGFCSKCGGNWPES